MYKKKSDQGTNWGAICFTGNCRYNKMNWGGGGGGGHFQKIQLQTATVRNKFGNGMYYTINTTSHPVDCHKSVSTVFCALKINWRVSTALGGFFVRVCGYLFVLFLGKEKKVCAERIWKQTSQAGYNRIPPSPPPSNTNCQLCDERLFQQNRKPLETVLIMLSKRRKQLPYDVNNGQCMASMIQTGVWVHN